MIASRKRAVNVGSARPNVRKANSVTTGRFEPVAEHVVHVQGRLPILGLGDDLGDPGQVVRLVVGVKIRYGTLRFDLPDSVPFAVIAVFVILVGPQAVALADVFAVVVFVAGLVIAVGGGGIPGELV